MYRARNEERKYSFTLKDPLDVSFAVQDTNNVHCIFLEGVIKPNGFKSSDRPSAKILEARIARRISRTYIRLWLND